MGLKMLPAGGLSHMALPADPTPSRIVILGRACVPGIHTHQPFQAYSEVMNGRDLRPGHDEHIENPYAIALPLGRSCQRS